MLYYNFMHRTSKLKSFLNLSDLLKPKTFPLNDGSTVSNLPIRLLEVISKAGMVEIGLCRHSLLDLDKSVKLAPAVLATGITFWETQAQGDGSLVEHKMDVFLLFAAQIAVAIWRDGLGRLDDLNVETGTEGGDVGDGEVVRSGIVIGWELICELAEAECSEDRNNVCIMGEVKVETLV